MRHYKSRNQKVEWILFEHSIRSHVVESFITRPAMARAGDSKSDSPITIASRYPRNPLQITYPEDGGAESASIVSLISRSASDFIHLTTYFQARYSWIYIRIAGSLAEYGQELN